MSENDCLCKTCPNYLWSDKKISISRRNKITSMLREHRQEKRNIVVYAQNIRLFLKNPNLLSSKKARYNEHASMTALVQKHSFCKAKVSMVVNTLRLLSTIELSIITGLYLDNDSVQQVSKDVGYEIAQVYRFAGLAVCKIALALPIW